jgi:hypothetical protein
VGTRVPFEMLLDYLRPGDRSLTFWKTSRPSLGTRLSRLWSKLKRRLATSDEQPLRRSPELSVEEVEPSREVVRQWFSLQSFGSLELTPVAVVVSRMYRRRGAHRVLGRDVRRRDREVDLRSVDSLLALVREHVRATGEVQLYAVWDGEEGSPPKSEDQPGTRRAQSREILLQRAVLSIA